MSAAANRGTRGAPCPASPRDRSSATTLGGLYVRVLVGDNDRESFPLDPKLTEEQAEQRKELVADLAVRLRASPNVTRDAIVALLERAAVHEGRALRDVIAAVDVICKGGARAKVVPGGASVPKQVSIQQFGQLWTSGELARMYPDHVKPKRSVEQDVYRFDRHIYPIAGHVPVAAFTLDDAERVMRALPAMSPASRRHIAQLLRRLMAMAVFPCRLVAANPLPRGFLPKLGPAKAKACLYPDEDARLLASTRDPAVLASRCAPTTRAQPSSQSPWRTAGARPGWPTERAIDRA
ncbi:hypothetical protein WME97_32670 [Sorangium sp. So ce367]|uniref:hypothetical protein n=1 Tax=Sorangium sp. So ce367 TaxID=3133305 RepID=UPI003F62198A